MDTVRRLLAAALIAMLSLFAVSCGDGGDEEETIEQQGGEDNGDDDNGDDD